MYVLLDRFVAIAAYCMSSHYLELNMHCVHAYNNTAHADREKKHRT